MLKFPLRHLGMPVIWEQACSWVRFLVAPPEYPSSVAITPFTF